MSQSLQKALKVFCGYLKGGNKEMKIRKNLALIGVALVGVFAFAACGNRNEEPEATPPPVNGGGAPTTPGGEPTPGRTIAQGGDLEVSIMSMPVSLMLNRNDSASAQFNKQVFDTLIHLYYSATDASLRPTPGLAESWEVVDPQTVNMTLRSGVLFHNGAPLTARDVEFSLMRAAVCPEASVVSSMIESVTVHDDLNFTIHLNIPFVPFINNLGHTIMGILHMDSYLEDPLTPIGTGAFKFDYYVIAEYVRLSRWDQFWGTPAHVDTLTFRSIPASDIRIIEANAGNVHIGMDIQAPDITFAESSTTATTLRRDNLSMNYVGFNMQPGSPFEDARVRRAVNYAIDVQAIIDLALHGLGRPLQGVPLSDVNADFAPGIVEPMGYNVARARELMAEAGHEAGFEANIWYNTGNVVRGTIATMMQFQLAEIGIRLNIQSFEWETYLDMTGNFEHDMFLLGWVSVVGDMDYALHPLFHSSNIGPAGNRFPINSARLDDVLDRARIETNAQQRTQLYHEALRLLDEYLPMALLNQGEFAIQVYNGVGGFVINPAGHHDFSRVFFYE